MSYRLTRKIYDAFQRADLDLWDETIDPDVHINSPAGFDIRGLATFKEFGEQFTALAYKIDLIDEFESVDASGNGRGFITFTLHWKHTAPFGPLVPTGREGTSVESMIFTIAADRVARIEVVDSSYDLALYLWERGWPMPHNVRPAAVEPSGKLTRTLHESFARRDFDAWDAIVSPTVVVDAWNGFDRVGLGPLVDFLREYTSTWRDNVLVDEALDLDPQGSGRGFVTYLVEWKHDTEVFGQAPTGREGTQVETMLLTVENDMITRIHFGSNTVDLPAYLWSRGAPVVHGVRPEPLVAGVDRRTRRGR